jgi:aminoglycoside phosphotransferase (APT) family kinase protein
MKAGEDIAVELLTVPAVCQALGLETAENVHVVTAGQRTYQVTVSTGTWIVRLARNEVHLSLLKKEARVQRGLRDWVTVLIPDTRIIDRLEDRPALAIHRMIPGEPLTSELYGSLSPEVRRRLVADLAAFFAQTHRIPLRVACEWLDIPFEGIPTVARLASTFGKPTWFSPRIAAQMWPVLLPLLDTGEKELWEDTVIRFDALDARPEFLVFGHGDLHGYNMALRLDNLGARLAGVFDLGCTGIMDIHEDLFRLSLIDETLPDDVMQIYGQLAGQARSLDRDRIAIYYRAFLFHLLAGATGPYVKHLRRALIQRHLAYSRTKGICT